MSFVSRLGLWPAQAGAITAANNHNPGVVIATTAIATAAVLSLLRRFLWPPQPQILRSPLHTVLPKLSQDELDKLDYKPDEFPGARDVETPYGSIRVYEWGPATGEKVLFVHGITTSCITLGKLARALVREKGCRVLLFDLFGRGFSDGPGDVPHDARLYVTQVLLALASSPDASWTGPRGRFRLVGYSLGGGVAAHFAAAFPHLVESLVLLAPAGLIRPESFGSLTRAVFTSGLVPPRLLAWLTRRRLRRPIRASSKRGVNNGYNNNNNKNHADPTTTTPKPDPVSAALAETTGEDEEPRNELEQRVLRQVHWQLAHHEGFVGAFMSCVRHAPLVGQEETWRRLGARPRGSTVVILGEGDEIIDVDEYAADALPLLGGADHVHWSVVPGGHDFPMTYAREALTEIYRAWGWE